MSLSFEVSYSFRNKKKKGSASKRVEVQLEFFLSTRNTRLLQSIHDSDLHKKKKKKTVIMYVPTSCVSVQIL